MWTTRRGAIADASNADRACEFFFRYEEDVARAKQLNQSAFRIGLNWAALCPEPGKGRDFAADQVDYYRRLLAVIRQQGMKSFVTLFHFCLPVWLSSEGGWLSEATVAAFADYAQRAAEVFGDLVDFWLTINEPMVYVYRGYIEGIWPPGEKQEYIRAFIAVRRMLEGHAQAYQAIHRVIPNAVVSYTKHWRPFSARNKFNPLDLMVRHYRDQVFNYLFVMAVQHGVLAFPFPISTEREIRKISGPIDGLRGALDYVAINFFTREICQFEYKLPFDIFGRESPVKRLETSGLGWELYPEGMFYLLTQDIAPFRYDHDGRPRPVYIIENGIASRHAPHLVGGDWSLHDEQRVRYLVSHLVSVHQAIERGIPVKGYLHWSITDNFEWEEGLTPRFGLVRVAYPSQERTVRDSGRLYAQIARDNAIDPHLVRRYRRLD